MNIFNELFPKELYHSYVIEGDKETAPNELLKYLEESGHIESNSPDVICQVYESFTMDDSREIKDWHSKLGVTEGKRVCIIASNFINREAEQTLLKIIEEPAENTHFFLVVPDASVLLDTIISRTHIIKIDSGNNKDIQKEALSFVASSLKDRIDKVAEIIKDNKSEENSGQLRYYATSFINELENIFYQKFKKDRKDEKLKFILEELQKSRGYLSTQGGSVKMVLEHLALVI
ncbi:MAG TPA: hypothetical protein VK153_02050 [Candidatus Paceibacterota bacterium]|nr:hypothetical protein [Candidatus Paceibacterota bacterium]